MVKVEDSSGSCCEDAGKVEDSASWEAIKVDDSSSEEKVKVERSCGSGCEEAKSGSSCEEDGGEEETLAYESGLYEETGMRGGLVCIYARVCMHTVHRTGGGGSWEGRCQSWVGLSTATPITPPLRTRVRGSGRS